MRILAILSFAFSLVALSCGASESDLKNQIETKISEDKGIENVMVILPPSLETPANLTFETLSYEAQPGRVEITASDKDNKKFQFKAKFAEAIWIPVLSSNKAKGTSISEDEIIMEKHAKSRDNVNYIHDFGEIEGMITKRTLLANKPLNKSDFAMPVIIEKGAVVKVVFQGNGVEIESRAIALENGSQNSMIKLRNPDSNKTIIAQVYDSETVVLKK